MPIGMGSLPTASRKTKCLWALSKASTTRSVCSSAGLTGCVTRNTSGSKSSAACCRKSKKLNPRTNGGQRRDAEVQRQSAKHLMEDRTPPEPIPVKSNAARGGGLKGQTLQE